MGNNFMVMMDRCDGDNPYADFAYSNEEAERALAETREDFATVSKVVSPLIDPIPGVGHAKALLHLAAGDTDGAKEAFLASTKTTAVMGAGAAAFVVAGPVGAVVAGVETGAVWDTGAMLASDGERCNGLWKIADTAKNDPTNVLGYVQGGVGRVGDGLTGYAGGKTVERMTRYLQLHNFVF
jgi:hypothetical protein